MDAIDEQFATGIVEGHELSVPLKHALAIGKRTLNKYYALTDASDIYRMAMGTSIIFFLKALHSWPMVVLHPSYKTTYFSRLSWSETWINDAIKVTRDSWMRYKPVAVALESQTLCAIGAGSLNDKATRVGNAERVPNRSGTVRVTGKRR